MQIPTDTDVPDTILEAGEIAEVGQEIIGGSPDDVSILPPDEGYEHWIIQAKFEYNGQKYGYEIASKESDPSWIAKDMVTRSVEEMVSTMIEVELGPE